MITLLVTSVSFLFYFVWLMFLSFLVSRFVVRGGRPLQRAALTVLVSVAIGWALAIGLDVVLTRGMIAYSMVWTLSDLILQLGVPLAVFLWEWRSFQRHWIPDEDIGEVFE